MEDSCIFCALKVKQCDQQKLWHIDITVNLWSITAVVVEYFPFFYFPVKANPCLPACVLCNMRSVTKYMEEKLNFAALLSASRYGFISYADGTVENIIWPRVFYIFSTFLFLFYIRHCRETIQGSLVQMPFVSSLVHNVVTSSSFPRSLSFLSLPSALPLVLY